MRKFHGTVKFWHERRGFGFLRSEDGVETFVHFSGLIGRKSLTQGEHVEFEVVEDGKSGRMQAANVKVIEAEQPAQQ